MFYFSSQDKKWEVTTTTSISRRISLTRELESELSSKVVKDCMSCGCCHKPIHNKVMIFLCLLLEAPAVCCACFTKNKIAPKFMQSKVPKIIQKIIRRIDNEKDQRRIERFCYDLMDIFDAIDQENRKNKLWISLKKGDLLKLISCPKRNLILRLLRIGTKARVVKINRKKQTFKLHFITRFPRRKTTFPMDFIEHFTRVNQ
jgi:hypothetical protein